MGGGALLMPALIILVGLSPSVAVGTSLVSSSIAKILAAWLHRRAGNVDMELVLYLLMGSIPGSILGSGCLQLLKIYFPGRIDHWIVIVTGLLLIIIPVFTLFRFLLGIIMHPDFHNLMRFELGSRIMISVIGLAGGFLVGFTSLGSGTIIVSLLILLFHFPAGKLVGTDITHAMFITLFSGALHLFFGNTDLPTCGLLLIGLLPGAYAGTLLCTRVPEKTVKSTITIFLIIIGFWLLMGFPGE